MCVFLYILFQTKFSKGRNDVEFVTAFNKGTHLTGYIEQCRFNNTVYLLNETVDVYICDNFTESFFNFSYEEGTKVSVNFPGNLSDTKFGDNSTFTYMYVSTELCDGESELTTRISLEISKSKSKSNALSAGAIVGIVCAGVLVLGLAAWWLCMKKGGGDQYRELDG